MLGVRVDERVRLVAPAAAEDVALALVRIVRTPLAYVAGHVGDAAHGDAARRADREWSFPREVAERDDEPGVKHTRGPSPMVNRGQ